MPHSSGGGGSSSSSGSGGFSSHSSSSRSSFGASASSPISKSYFPGAYRYVKYDKNGTPSYIYSASDSLNKRSSTREQQSVNYLSRAFALVCLIPFLLLGVRIFKMAVIIPTKLHVKYQNEIVIDDKLQIITDDEETALRQELEIFKNKTGIPVYIVTDDDSNWRPKYVELEQYAYDLYLTKFGDESHWLIIYSQRSDPDHPSARADVWRFEGMQGDDTDNILNNQLTNGFNNVLQTKLRQKWVSVGSAFISSFRELNDAVMKVSVNGKLLFFAFFWNGLILFMLFMIVLLPVIQARKYEEYQLCMDAETLKKNRIYREKQERLQEGRRIQYLDSLSYDDKQLLPCPSCGRYYFRNIQSVCPFCSAPNFSGGEEEYLFEDSGSDEVLDDGYEEDYSDEYGSDYSDY